MAGSPLKRECNLGVVADEGSLIAFPRLNHLRSGLSHGRWRALSPGEKIERLLGMNLYRVAEILSWKPITELDPLRALVTMQVIRVGRCGSNLPVPGRSGKVCNRRNPSVAARLGEVASPSDLPTFAIMQADR